MAGEQPTSLVGQEISGCEILQKVAMGGMGAIYKARHKALDRIVCVKILSPSLTNDKKAVELFLTEARAIAELEHPNIVQVYNVGKEKGYYFIVMAFIEGQTLSQLVKKHKTLPIDLVLNLFEGVLLGLDAAHSKGIIHRDIKPSNILINAQMQPKIVDFGIAKKVDKEKGSTKTTELAGTAYFIAPEQALGRDLDTRADLYSVGASLYYVLTGQFPYNGKNTIDIIQKHINDPIPNPAELRPNLPAWLAKKKKKLMITQTRQTEKKLKTSTSTKPSLLPSLDNAVTLPNTTSSKTSAAEKEKQPHPDMLGTNSAKKVEVFNPAPSPVQQKLRENARGTVLLFTSVLFKLPIFVLFTILVAYVFHQFGLICSVHTVPTNGLIANLISPFVAEHYVTNQLLFTFLAVVLLGLIFASAAVKAYARSTMTLLFLAIAAYMAGLFTPENPFLGTHHIMQFIFTPEYYLCYLCVALLWAISFCFTYNRTLLQGCLASSLVALVLVLSYLAPHLSIAPAADIPTFKILFFASILSAIISIYYLINRNEKTAVVFPLVFLLLSSAMMWIYTVSGAVQTMQTTTKALVSNIHPKNLNNSNSNTEIETEMGIHSTREVFAKINKVTDISIMDEETSNAFFNNQLQLLAPYEFTEENSPVFIRLLKNYYNGGESNMRSELWSYVLTLPIDNFNRNAKNNDAYTFMMLLLMALSIGFCVGTLVLVED